MSPEPLRRALFLDRDGTVIDDVGYPSDPDQVCLIPGAAAAIRGFREAGMAVVLVSNQSGVGRGFFTMQDLDRVHRRTLELLEEHGTTLDGAYYCPHAPDAGCECRKPRTGLIDRARKELGLAGDGCFLIGDSPSDVEAGAAAGCKTVLFGSAEAPSVTPTWRASTWVEIVELLTPVSR